ncbi:MAG: hypothetical protein KF886_18105 [Candidatus Hydrogenedentes bacterium]|nr:hypothetical protein [Candidatus Hydrogenedentota bacterium]
MYEIIEQNQGAFIVFFFTLALACLAVAAYFAYLVRHTERKADQRLKQARADITDMTILFQTMRDIIGQQKSLAKDFNEELEHKMEQVKHILHQGMEKNKQLYEKQQRITAELEEAQARIDGIYRQLARAQAPAPAGPAPNGAKAPEPATAPPRKPAPALANLSGAATLPPRAEPAVQPARPAQTPAAALPRTSDALVREPLVREDPRDLPATPRDPDPLPARAAAPARDRAQSLTPEEAERLRDTGVTRAPFTSWIAEDLLPPEPAIEEKQPPPRPAPPAPAPPDPADAGPGNGDAAREAFRALLNMPAQSPASPDIDRPLDFVPGDSASRDTHPAPPESQDHLSIPLQQRVLEYSEAGMTVAQVSRELGIGKGEVRLMLSLARQQSPPRA